MEEYIRNLFREEFLTIPEIAEMMNLTERHIRYILGYPPEV